MLRASRKSRIVIRAGLHAVPTTIGIVILSFLMLQFAPGDAVDVLAGEAGGASADSMAEMRARYGLDRSVLDQLFTYLSNLARGNLGWSPRYNVPVTQLIWDRLPGSLALAGAALTVALVAGILLGAIMAVNEGKLADRLLSCLSLVFYSVPSFWTGLMLIVLFSIKLGWLPSSGAATIGSTATGLAALGDKLRYMILPTISMSLFYIAIYARLTRIAMIEAKGQDYVRTARAKGLSERRVLFRHVLRNAMLPVTTVAGVHIGGIFGATVVIETVYGWPGLGRLAYEAVMGRDFSVLLGILLFSSLLVVFVNALVDIVHGILDPRVGGGEVA
jgi:peptide/nickel transport system permease protein